MSRARSMMGTALASLLAFSKAAWPPRLKMPTLYPVFPRFRVGMESEVEALEGRGLGTRAGCAPAISGRAAEPSAAAVMIPPALRKARRLLFDDLPDDDLPDVVLLMTSSRSRMPSTLTPISIRIHG